MSQTFSLGITDEGHTMVFLMVMLQFCWLSFRSPSIKTSYQATTHCDGPHKDFGSQFGFPFSSQYFLKMCEVR